MPGPKASVAQIEFLSRALVTTLRRVASRLCHRVPKKISLFVYLFVLFIQVAKDTSHRHGQTEIFTGDSHDSQQKQNSPSISHRGAPSARPRMRPPRHQAPRAAGSTRSPGGRRAPMWAETDDPAILQGGSGQSSTLNHCRTINHLPRIARFKSFASLSRASCPTMSCTSSLPSCGSSYATRLNTCFSMLCTSV